MTVLVFERHPVVPERSPQFEARAGELLQQMRRAAGALWADAARALEDDPSYVIVSEWRTAADADAWQQGAEAARFADETEICRRSDATHRRFTSP